jgi:hypothetical protein
MHTGTPEEQHGESAGRADPKKCLLHYIHGDSPVIAQLIIPARAFSLFTLGWLGGRALQHSPD